MTNGLFVAALATAIFAAPASTPEYVADIARAKASLNTFARTKSLAILRDAVASLAQVGIDERNPAGDPQNRRALVAAYCRVFADIDRDLDPAFDPNDRHAWPSIHVERPAGSSPAHYQREIRSADAKIAHMAFQIELRRMDGSALSFLRATLVDFHATTVDDRADLHAIVETAGLSTARIVVLEEVIDHPTRGG